MLSKDQADAIANAVLNQTQSSRLEGRKSMVHHVPLIYRCRELAALEPWQRKEVVKQATKATNSNLLFIVVLLAGLATQVALFGEYKFSSMAPFIAVFYFSALLLRVLIVRREIRKITAKFAFSSTASNAHGFPSLRQNSASVQPKG